jgi:hypothetical protein
MERNGGIASQKRYRASIKRIALRSCELKNRKKPVNHVGCGLVSGKLNYAIIMRG